MLLRNFLRDIKGSLPRLLAVIAVTALGVMIYIGMSGVNANLTHLVDTYLEEASVSDLWITAANADARDVRELRALEPVASVMPRITLQAKWNEDDQATLKVHSYDEFIQCLPYIEEGLPPSGARECMLAASFAKARGLKVGDKLELKYGGGLLRFTITALVISPEYIYNVSGMDLFPNPYKNGFVYVPEAALYTTYGRHIYNELLVKGTQGTASDALISSVKDVLGERCLAVLKFEDNVRAHMLYDEMEQLSAMTTTLPSLFFLTAALIMFTTMQRVAAGSRTMIGTLKAIGYSDAAILIYFLGYSILVVAFGAVAGALPGRAITGFMMNLFNEYVELPPHELLVDWASLLGAVAIASVCCVGSAFFTTVREVRTSPSQCMRPRPPKRSRRNIIERSPLWRILGFSTKTIVRNIFRNRMRAVMCIVGVGLCMALIVTALGMNDTTKRLLDDLYEKLHRYDLQVTLDSSAGIRETEHIKRMGGMIRVESQMSRPVEAGGDAKRVDTSVQVVEDEMTLMVIDQSAQNGMIMPHGSAYVAKMLADELGLEVGGEIFFKPIGARRGHTLRIGGIAPNINGIYVGRTLWRSLGESFQPGSLYILCDETETSKRALEDYDFVMSVKSKQEVVAAFDSQMEMMDSVIAIMILFGGVLAFVVLYSLGIMNFYDRTRDLATLSVLGFFEREIKRLILSENMVFSVLGVLLGALLGMPLLKSLMTQTSMGELTFVPVVLDISYLFAAALTILYAVIVNLMLGRKTRKIDMLGALKSVE